MQDGQHRTEARPRGAGNGSLLPRTLGIPLALLLAATVDVAALGAQQLTSETLSGLELRTIGPAAMSGRIVDLAVVEDDPTVFYMASATGGVWKTTNNGVTVEPVFENQGTHSVGDITVHQRDTSVVWVGTGERANRQSNSWGDGVYRSTDGGDTWEHMGLEDSHHIGRIVLHPDDPDVVYVAAMGHLWGPNEERGLYRSTDGGETWERILAVDEHTGAVDVALKPDDPDVVLAAMYQRRRKPYGFHGGGPGSGLYRSTDGGDSWEKLGPEQTGTEHYICEEGEERSTHADNGLPLGDWGRVGIDFYRSDPSIVYVSIEQGCRYSASTTYDVDLAGLYRSEDGGRTWEHRSNWNPRPMYASQPIVDPNDDQRIYMVNFLGVSEDGGETHERLNTSVHGDERHLWINPDDSRHIINANDGGIGISYDRGETWLYLDHLPVSQFYRVSVDMRDPYWVYGGLQDNGSWAGPNATYRSEGVINMDWFRTGGGDGFKNVVDTTATGFLFNESQYLGLSRYDLETHESQDVRPGDPTGHISGRRNWEVWGTGEEPPLLGNAMEPANWDGPFLVSQHDPFTVYAGTRHLWKSEDRGVSWENLGDPTTGTERRDLPIMGQEPGPKVLSLDDGIPYWPTITEIAESPVREGLVYVGTDDGQLRVTDDGGETWTELSDRVPGLPDTAWINGVEPSSHDEETVYLAANNYRNDDFGNYVYRSDDRGQSWESIAEGLPEGRVARTIREDPRNPDVLYLGTEIGLFVSIDRGERWVELRNNMPTMAFNDLLVHPRDNDLVLGTHSRGIWILDDVSAIQELTSEVLASDSHLFSLAPARMIRYESQLGHRGDVFYEGENPPAGAIVDYYLGEEVDREEISLTVHDPSGERIRVLEPDTGSGINRVVWDLRHEPLDALEEGDDDGERAMDGPLVVPGTYAVRLEVDGREQERRVVVREDPRIELDPVVRRDWTETLLEIAGMYGDATDQLRRVRERDGAGEDAGPSRAAELEDRIDELRDRIGSLYRSVRSWTGEPTADQRSRKTHYEELLGRFGRQLDDLQP